MPNVQSANQSTRQAISPLVDPFFFRLPKTSFGYFRLKTGRFLFLGRIKGDPGVSLKPGPSPFRSVSIPGLEGERKAWIGYFSFQAISNRTTISGTTWFRIGPNWSGRNRPCSEPFQPKQTRPKLITGAQVNLITGCTSRVRVQQLIVVFNCSDLQAMFFFKLG